MKNYKNIIYLLLALGAIILLSLLTGCKKSGEVIPQETPAQQQDDLTHGITDAWLGQVTWVHRYTYVTEFIVEFDKDNHGNDISPIYYEWDAIDNFNPVAGIGQGFRCNYQFGIQVGNTSGGLYFSYGHQVNGPTKNR